MNTQELDQALNQQILGGDIMGAFEKYYAEDVVMQENSAEPFVGKAFNRERELQFVNSIAEFHGAAVLASASRLPGSRSTTFGIRRRSRDGVLPPQTDASNRASRSPSRRGPTCRTRRSRGCVRPRARASPRARG